MLKRRTGPHTRFIAKHAGKDRKGLAAIIAEANSAIEKNAFLVRRSEYLLQQSVMLRAQAEELDRDRVPLVQMIIDLTHRMEKLLDKRDARVGKRTTKRKGRKRG